MQEDEEWSEVQFSEVESDHFRLIDKPVQVLFSFFRPPKLSLVAMVSHHQVVTHLLIAGSGRFVAGGSVSRTVIHRGWRF